MTSEVFASYHDLSTATPEHNELQAVPQLTSVTKTATPQPAHTNQSMSQTHYCLMGEVGPWTVYFLSS